jgi:hypothetical protein
MSWAAATRSTTPAPSFGGTGGSEMVPTLTNRAVLLFACAVAVVGGLDAGFGGSWDLVAVFILVASMQLVLLLRLSSRRPAVPLRSDLVCWLRDRAALEGDTAELIADRAVSAYRADLLGTSSVDQSDEAG